MTDRSSWLFALPALCPDNTGCLQDLEPVMDLDAGSQPLERSNSRAYETAVRPKLTVLDGGFESRLWASAKKCNKIKSL
jgi:hypothetical protein